MTVTYGWAAALKLQLISGYEPFNLRHYQNVANVEGAWEGSVYVPGSPGDRTTVVDAADGYLAVETESQATRFLVISEIWHPGWRALLDDRPLPVVRKDLALTGAWLPAERHRLVLEFRSLHWRTALTISVLPAFVFLTLLVAYFVRPREPQAGVPWARATECALPPADAERSDPTDKNRRSCPPACLGDACLQKLRMAGPCD